MAEMDARECWWLRAPEKSELDRVHDEVVPPHLRRTMILSAIETERTVRFSEEDIDHAMKRLSLSGAKGRAEVVSIIRNFDRGIGDIDDVIDEWENDPGY